jgi:hypothetical protein
MKKAQVVLVMGVLLGLLFSAANVFAGADVGVSVQANKTPGAKATDKAIERATQGKGGQGQHGKKKNYKGVVAAVSAGSLTLTLADGSSATFTVNEATRIHIPTFGKSATLADIPTGVNAIVQAKAGEDGSLIALRINVKPGKPVKVHRVGVVTAYTEGVSITIQAKDGETSTFALTADTKILPKDRATELAVGVRVTIISRRNVTGSELTAQGIVVHPATDGEGGDEDGTSGTKTPKPTKAPKPTESEDEGDD